MLAKFKAALAVLAIDINKIKVKMKRLEIRPVVKDGINGKRGFTGEDGKIGPQGMSGENGEPGKDGETGIQGRKGLRGPKGPRGDIGDKGNTGDTGLQGIVGKKGETGPIGPIGPQGLRGPKGKDGKNGISITKVSMENNVLFVWLDGVRRKIGGIKTPDTSVFIPGGGGRGRAGKDGGVRHTVENNDPEPWTIPNNRQATVHGDLIVEGNIILENNAQLIMEI